MKIADIIRTDREKYIKALGIAQTQARDAALWCPTTDITFAYLQQELRRLHSALEGSD